MRPARLRRIQIPRITTISSVEGWTGTVNCSINAKVCPLDVPAVVFLDQVVVDKHSSAVSTGECGVVESKLVVVYLAGSRTATVMVGPPGSVACYISVHKKVVPHHNPCAQS